MASFLKVGTLAATIGVAAVLGVSACGSSDSGAGEATSAHSGSEVSIADQLAGGSERPEGFPTDVPVVEGNYMAYSAPVPDSVGLEISQAQAGTFDAAIALLEDSGYSVQSAPTASGETLRTGTFVNDKYQVSVTGVTVADMYRVTYQVVMK